MASKKGEEKGEEKREKKRELTEELTQAELFANLCKSSNSYRTVTVDIGTIQQSREVLYLICKRVQNNPAKVLYLLLLCKSVQVPLKIINQLIFFDFLIYVLLRNHYFLLYNN